MKARHTIALVLLVSLPSRADGQWTATYEQFYFPARDNWVFRREYPSADRLFNAFDYGHAILYERLYLRPEAGAAELEQREYDFLTQHLLVSPPRLPLKEMAIMPHYTRLAPEAKQMFEWAHILHRQVYDVLADERLDAAAREARIAELTRYYLSRRDLAFSTHPKTMALMQEQPYSLAFREKYPKFNGLIWGYHWLQVGLYEPLVAGSTRAERQAGVAASVARFRQMLTDPPRTLPYQMPMTSAIAPVFAQRYPTLAIIFDNLHSMHDVISDILASPKVPRGMKRAEILRAAARYRDDTTEVMTVDGWRRMAEMMGVQNMGGAARGFLAQLPTPTVPRGYVMRHDREGNMLGGDHTGHVLSPDTGATPVVSPHAHHDMSPSSRDSLDVLAVVNALHLAMAAGDSVALLGLLGDDATVGEAARMERKSDYRTGALFRDLAFAVAVPRHWHEMHARRMGAIWQVTSRSSVTGEFQGQRVDRDETELVELRREGLAWRITNLQRSARARSPGALPDSAARAAVTTP